MATLAEIRAKLHAQDKAANTASSDNTIFPFWNMPEDTTSVIRFLPDGNDSNTFFWHERQMIRLEFPGVKGDSESRRVTVNVPCNEMWGPVGSCPVLAEVREWFKDPSLEDMGRKYWKKKSYIFQGFVVDSSLKEDSTPQNPIRRLIINPSIFKIIKAALLDPDMESIPTDYEAGTDFRLTKSQKGQYADYSTSNWARRERSLTSEERAAIETHGLYDLNDFMPKQPNDQELQAIKEMFEASVDGREYDPELWGNYYRPAGVQIDTNRTANKASTENAVKTQPVEQKQDDGIPFKSNEEVQQQEQEAASVKESATVSAGTDRPSAQDILAAIRNRK